MCVCRKTHTHTHTHALHILPIKQQVGVHLRCVVTFRFAIKSCLNRSFTIRAASDSNSAQAQRKYNFPLPSPPLPLNITLHPSSRGRYTLFNVPDADGMQLQTPQRDSHKFLSLSPSLSVRAMKKPKADKYIF